MKTNYLAIFFLTCLLFLCDLSLLKAQTFQEKIDTIKKLILKTKYDEVKEEINKVDIEVGKNLKSFFEDSKLILSMCNETNLLSHVDRMTDKKYEGLKNALLDLIEESKEPEKTEANKNQKEREKKEREKETKEEDERKEPNKNQKKHEKKTKEEANDGTKNDSTKKKPAEGKLEQQNHGSITGPEKEKTDDKLKDKKNEKKITSNDDNPMTIVYVLLGLIAIGIILLTIYHIARKNKLKKPEIIKTMGSTREETNDNGEKDMKDKENNFSSDKLNQAAAAAANEKYLFGEVLLTAGPRKEHGADKDMGEDVAGLIVTPHKSYFWVLDGTSDSNKFSENNSKIGQEEDFTHRSYEYFSSRWLAQSLAWELQFLSHEMSNDSARSIVEKSINFVREKWNTKINGLTIEQCLNKEERQELLERLKQITRANCSTTLVFGILDVNGNLDYAVIGDSKLVYFPQKKEVTARGRIYMQLSVKNNDIYLEHNTFEDMRIESAQVNNVTTVVAATDGISNNTLKILKGDEQVEKNGGYLDFSDVRIYANLVRQKMKTQDDKALCFVQIKKNK